MGVVLAFSVPQLNVSSNFIQNYSISLFQVSLIHKFVTVIYLVHQMLFNFNTCLYPILLLLLFVSDFCIELIIYVELDWWNQTYLNQTLCVGSPRICMVWQSLLVLQFWCFIWFWFQLQICQKQVWLVVTPFPNPKQNVRTQRFLFRQGILFPEA